MYEHRRNPVIPRPLFVRRVLGHGGVALLMTVGSLLIGVVGFHVLEGWAWIDAFLGSSMLLSGMGPTLVPTTELGKLFAAFYAMFSGVLYLSVSAVLLAPFFHRVMHKMSVEAS